MKTLQPSAALLALAVLAAPATSFAAGEEDVAYSAVVEKVMGQYCAKCHSNEKKKGKLNLATYEDLVKGGESASKGKATLTPGKSADSLLYTTLVLPKEEDEHMPPEDKPQPSEKEIAVIKWWIDSGASKDAKIKDLNPPAELKATILELAAKPAKK